MRGEVCLGVAGFLSLVSLLLLIFAHVGQINTGSVPRGIYMARVDTGAYIHGMRAAIFPNEVNFLYAVNDTIPLQQKLGIRTTYDWGLYSYCARLNGNPEDSPILDSSEDSPEDSQDSNNSEDSNGSDSDVDSGTHGLCSNQTVAFAFRPWDVLVSDLPDNYTTNTRGLIKDDGAGAAFRDSQYLGDHTQAAYYMLLIGTVLAALSFFTLLFKHTGTLMVSSILHVFSALFILVGAAIWTVMIKKANEISELVVDRNNDITPLGIHVSLGPGLLLVWAAFAVMTASIVPSMISCLTYRG